MQEQSIHTHQFDNGLMLIVEPMKDVQSASFSFLVPAGSVYDGDGKNGSAGMLADWISRGAGELDSRNLSASLDNMGLQRNENAGTQHITFAGATVADRLVDCLKVYSDILRRPHLPEDQFESVQMGAEQALRAVEDEPQQKALVELRRHSFQKPWSLPSDGTLEDLPNISMQSVKEHYDRCFRPNGAILGVAGNVDVDDIIRAMAEVYGDWEPKPEVEITPGDFGLKRIAIEHESSQTHIGLSYASVPYSDPDYYSAWAAVGVLSGGSSSRLFTEVREKRGLCYSVSASLNSMKHEGRVVCYAGTQNERAQETLDVTLDEITKLGDGITESELDRCKARAKSSLIMQQESTYARSGSIARDWFYLGHVTTLQEVRDKIDALTPETVLDYVHRKPAEDFTVLTIGPQELTVNA
jgi:predicted Zn-dependent peptidase